MFARLPESNARRQRRTGGLVTSTVLHALLIALAVRATGLKAAPAPETEPIAPVWVAPTPKPPAPSPPRRVFTDETLPKAPGGAMPKDISIPMPDVLDHIPDAGSMSGLLEPAFDATKAAVTGQPAGLPNVSDGAPLRENMVEKAVVAIPGTATPRYPSMLQSAGVEGDVRTQFVVDTLGHVEKGSVQILESGHEQFAAAVRDALARARFKPAEAGGRKVRQLVEQTFTFRIKN